MTDTTEARKITFALQQLRRVRSDQDRHYFELTLRADQTAQDAFSMPEAFKQIQGDRDKKLSARDMLNIISSDGLKEWRECPVVRAGAGVWLDKPSRVIEYEAETLAETPTHRVIPVGTRFAVQDKQSKAISGTVHYNDVATATSAMYRETSPRAVA